MVISTCGWESEHTYSSTFRPKFCFKQKFCTELSMMSTAAKFCIKQSCAFLHQQESTIQQHIIHQVIILLINHLLSHKSTKQEQKLLEAMQYSESPQKIESITISNNHTCVVTEDHKNTGYILLTFLLLGICTKPRYFKKVRNAAQPVFILQYNKKEPSA